jgi:hypothetical protein
MLKYRNSIAGLMIFTALFGTAAASLLNASRLWASVIPMLTTMLLLASILGMTFRRGESRAAWAGFMVFGWGFVLLSMLGNWSKDALVNPSEETRGFLHWLDFKKKIAPVIGQYSDVKDYRRGGTFAVAKVLDSYSPGNYTVQFEDGYSVGANKGAFRKTNEEFYFIVGNSLGTLLFAFAGMLFSIYFYAPRMKHAPPADTSANASSG